MKFNSLRIQDSLTPKFHFNSSYPFLFRTSRRWFLHNPSETTKFRVMEPDPFARTRVIAYAKKQQQHLNHPSLFQNKEVTIATKTLYEASVVVTLAGVERIAMGVGPTTKDAEIAAAMHAELMMDALSIPVFSLPSSQRKHVEARRLLGLWAPLPREDGNISTPPSPTNPSSSSSTEIFTTPVRISEMQSVVVTPPPPSQNPSTTKQQKSTPPPSTKLPPNPPPKLCPRNPTTIPSTYDESENGKFAVVYPTQMDEMCSSSLSCGPTNVMDPQAKPRVLTYMRRLLNEKETYPPPLKCTPYSTLDGIPFTQVEIEIPLPKSHQSCYNNAPTVKAIGVATSQKNAEMMAWMHAEYMLDAMGISLYGKQELQAEHKKYVEFFGRSAPSGPSGATPILPCSTLPLPFRLSLKPAPPGRPFMEEYFANPRDVDQIDPTAFDVVHAYFQSRGCQGPSSVWENQFLYTVRFLSRCDERKIAERLIEGQDDENSVLPTVPTSSSHSIGERMCFRSFIKLPITNAIIYGVGGSKISLDSVVLAAMHACELFQRVGMCPSNNWTPDPEKLKSLETNRPPSLRRLKDKGQLPVHDLVPPEQGYAKVFNVWCSQKSKSTKTWKDEDVVEQPIEKVPSSSLPPVASAAPSPSSSTTLPLPTSPNEPLKYSPDGAILCCVINDLLDRPHHSLVSPGIMNDLARSRVRRYHSRLTGELLFADSSLLCLTRPDPNAWKHQPHHQQQKNTKVYLYHLYRCKAKVAGVEPPAWAIGEGLTHPDAEFAMAMHYELILDAMGVPLFPDERVQALHVEYIQSKGRMYNNKVMPPPIRNVKPYLHDAQVVYEVEGVSWDLHDVELIEFNSKHAYDAHHQSQRFRHHRRNHNSSTTTTSLDANSLYLMGLSYAVSQYFRTVCPHINTATLAKPSGRRVGQNVIFAEGWLPMPDGKTFKPLAVVGPPNELGMGLSLYASRVLDSIGYKLFPNEPAKQLYHEEECRKAGREVSPTLTYDAPLPRPIRIINDKNPFKMIRWKTEEAKKDIARRTRPPVARKPTPVSVTRFKMVTTAKHNNNTQQQPQKKKTKKSLEQPSSDGQRIIHVPEEQLTLSTPKNSAPSTATVAVLNIPTTPTDTTSLASWHTYAEQCLQYVSDVHIKETVERLRKEKAPKTGTLLVDMALEEAETQPLEVHAKTLMYNFCQRTGNHYPQYISQYINKTCVISFEVPGHPYTAVGAGKNGQTAIRRAIMHCIEILKLVDPEFQHHMRRPVAPSLTTLNMTPLVMKQLVEMYILCLDLPQLKTCTRHVKTGLITTVTCSLTLTHGDNETYTFEGSHGHIRNAEEIAISNLFQKMTSAFPAFQSLLDIMRTHPQLRPEHVISLDIPPHLREIVNHIVSYPEYCGEDVSEDVDDECSDKGETDAVAFFSTTQHPIKNHKHPRRPTPFANLPILSIKANLLQSLKTSPVVIVCGTTGSGKTTQIPQYILDESPNAKIIVTQPRRISAMSIAARVASELGTSVGGLVGYSVRFDTKLGSNINFCTTGVVLRMMLKDPDLENVTHLIIDEIHERDVNTDFLLLLVKSILRENRNETLRVIIMSATLNAKTFQDYFRDDEEESNHNEDVPVVSVEGGVFPVTTYHLDDLIPLAKAEKFKSTSIASYERGIATSATTESAVSPIDYPLLLWLLRRVMVNDNVRGGSVLVFLPGLSEIFQVANSASSIPNFKVIILHSNVSPVDQMKCFEPAPPNIAKLVLATNIAESAVTIPDVRVVIDCGKMKEMVHFTHFGTTNVGKKLQTTTKQLVLKNAAQANCIQRKGRAGRTQGGICYRLFSKREYDAFEPYSLPEIQRVPLEGLVLTVLSMGVDDVSEFFQNALDPPNAENVTLALQSLYQLGAVDEDMAAITPLGKILNRFPTEPAIARTLVVGSAVGCLDAVLTLAAATDVKNIFRTTDEEDNRITSDIFMGKCHSDHLAVLNIYNQYVLHVVNNDRDGLRKFLTDNNLNETQLKLLSKLKQQYHNILRGIGCVDSNNRGHLFSNDAVFLDLSAHSVYSTHTALVKAMLCCMYTPDFAIHSGILVGSRNFEYRTKMEPVVRLHQSSCILHQEGMSPFVCFSEEQFSAKSNVLYLRNVSVVSVWSVILFGVENSALTYRDDLNLCVIDEWVLVNMTEDTYDDIRRLKTAFHLAVMRKLQNSNDERNNAMLGKLSLVMEHLVKHPVTSKGSEPWKEHGEITKPHKYFLERSPH